MTRPALPPAERAELLDAVLPVLRQHAREVDLTAAFPTDNLAALRKSGLLGLLVPQRYGGLGGDLADLVEIAGELAAECLSTAMIWAMHCQQVDVLLHHASAPLRDRLLPRIAAGDVYLASVTTEAGKGGHLLSADAAITRQDDDLLIDRMAPVVTGGEYADGFLITMRTSPDATAHEVSLVYADRDQLTLAGRGNWDPLGMRGTHSLGFSITGRVGADQLLGEPGGFRAITIESMVPAGHLGWAACWLGGARAAYAGLLRMLRSPDRPSSIDLGSPLVAERLARIRLDLEAVSAYLHAALAEVVTARRAGEPLSGTATQLHLNSLKVLAAELTFQAVDRMVQVGGLGLAYRRDSPLPLERVFRDLRSASLNYANDRLLVTNGALCMMDTAVTLLR
ncbi:acyl-CoA/acyl-ACP dehydrogenase [Plantactinospora sp. S1510]|uniref:Acyl-CoA/acyl-ACP dehydrogenase n=2 Tax=Plantactinospora alkalitolerans TaxID=2789879 RepID=A0ABS0GQQ9_9ACTN|nr:acyl-CoA/acyl-ACP dehydrogenase [Plantactinospora alkalitolerans]